MNPALIYNERAGAIWARLSRPQVLNAINPEIIEGLHRALDAAESSATARSVILTGTGRAFCSGADLKFVRETTGDDEVAVARFLQDLLALFARLERFPAPVIAVVNGLALAGGLELVLCCDLVVAAESARFGDAHSNYGLLPGGGSSVRLPRRIGPTRAKYLLYTGDFISAADMHAAGLVNEVVADEDLDFAAERLAGKLADKSSLVLRRMKALVDDGLEQSKETALRLELLNSELHVNSADMREGLAAFSEKRRPVFTGR